MPSQSLIAPLLIDQLINLAFREDIPNGDLTTKSLSLPPQVGEAHLVAKEDLVLSGKEAFSKTVKKLDASAEIIWSFKEGDLILEKQIVAIIKGDLLQVLQAERIGLNFLGHLSGIATLTACFVKKIEHTKTKILDTRKTLPCYRALEKQAVLHGGGLNHRMNLSDAILVKENHIDVTGGFSKTIESIRKATSRSIEVEVKNIDEVRQAIELRVDRIMLDNMNNQQLEEALAIIPKTIQTEASGNMTLDRIQSVAELGVDFISVGALTHSAPCADLSLLFLWNDVD